MSDVSKAVTTAKADVATWWKDVTGWLRHETGRLSARKVLGTGILVLFLVLVIQIMKASPAGGITEKVNDVLNLWPLFVVGAGLIGLTVKPLA
jgi:hypothetical protein